MVDWPGLGGKGGGSDLSFLGGNGGGLLVGDEGKPQGGNCSSCSCSDGLLLLGPCLTGAGGGDVSLEGDVGLEGNCCDGLVLLGPCLTGGDGGDVSLEGDCCDGLVDLGPSLTGGSDGDVGPEGGDGLDGV